MGIYDEIQKDKIKRESIYNKISASKDNNVVTSRNLPTYNSSSQTYTNIINNKASNSNDKIISDYANTLNKKEEEKQNYVSNSVNNRFKSATNDSLFAKIQAEKEFERTYNDKQYTQSKREYVNKYMPSNTLSDYINADYSKLPSALYEQIGKPLIKTVANIPVKVAEGALKGGEGILDTLTYVGGNAINLGANKLGLTSDQDYEIYKGAINNMVKDDLTGKAMKKFGWDEEMTSKFEEGSVVRKDNLFGQVAQGVGQMFPTLLVGTPKAQGGLGLGNLGATVTSGTSSFGSSLEEAYKEGASDKDAVMYAIGKTAVEIGSEWITGGIPGLKGKGGLDYLADKGIDKISNELIKELTRYGYSMVGEGAEEALAEILTPILKNTTYSEGEQINWADVINSAIVGGITGGVLEAPMNISNISSAVQNMQNKQNIQNTSTSVVQESVYDRIINSNNNDAEISNNQQRAQNNTNNTNNTTNNLIESAKKYNIDTNSETVKSINQVLTNRNIESIFDSSVFNSNSENALWTKTVDTEGNVKRTVVFNPKSNTETILQNVAVHELTHDIISGNEQNSFSNVLEFVKTREGYDQARIDLEKQYASLKDKNGNFIYDKTSNEFSNMIDEEVVASVLGEKLGDENFIRELNNYQPSTAKKIYNWVIDKLNKLNKMVGYKSEKLYWQDVKNKFEQLYNSEYKNNSNDNSSRNMFVGINGINDFISKNPNENWLIDNYNNAQKMSKKYDNEFVRKKTGWFRDSEGDWKFEISDKDAEIVLPVIKNKTYKLGELLKHDDLYSLYSDLKSKKVTFKDFPIEIKNGKKYATLGRTNSINGNIELNNNLISKGKDAILDSLVHEIQHQVQKQENFSRGSNTILRSFDKYKNQLGEKEARNTTERRKLDEYQRKEIQPQILKENMNFSKIEKTSGNWYNYIEVEKNVEKDKTNNILDLQSNNGRGRIHSGIKRGRRELDNSSFSLDSKESNWNKFVESNFKGTRQGETLQEIKKNKDSFKQSTVEERLSNDARMFNLENNSKTINNKEKNKPVRKYSESVQKSDVLDQKIVQEVLDSTDFTYVAQSNKKQVEIANKQIENFGYDGALKQFNNFYDSNKRVTANDLALGQRLLQEASKKGDVATVSDLLPKVAALGTELGQAVQVLSIINRLTPEGQLRVLHRTIDRLKARNVKGADKLNLTEEQINKILNSKDKTELNKNVTEVVEQLADKLPSTLSEKLNSWRYLSMLGNPKTHIRNLVSNSAMLGTSSVKNLIAKTLEGTVDTLNRKFGKNHFIFKNENRTKTWKKTTVEVKNFVKAYQTELNNTIDRSSKYSVEGEIQKAKKIFGKKGIGKFAQTLSDFNSNALTFEDMLFKNIAFSRAMEQYLTANGMETKADIDNNPKLVENAKIYAIEESLKATFQQYSALASYLNRIDNKAGRLALDSIIPFTKTPINVAKTGIAYSPLGLVKSLTADSIKLKKGDITVSQYIDNISQGLTGSGIVALGMMLAQMGIIQGAGEDDKEGQYDEALGQQSYSINIGGASFTLDWLSPVAMPLFVGAEIEKAREKGIEDAFNVNSVTKMFTSTLDPIMSMSFLQGINNALNSYSYNGMQSVIEESIKSYIGQYFPTLGGQLAKTIDPTIRSTSVSKDSRFTLLEQIIRTNAAKIPGVSYLLEPATDVWGNEKKRSDSVLERAFENFIAPYSKKEDITTEIDKELKSIYSSTGEDKVLPNAIINKYITYKGEKYETNAESYTQYKKTYGQTAYDTSKELFKTDTYKNADDNEKADMIDKVYDYASDKAKQEFLKSKGVTYTNSSKDNIDVYKENSIVEAIKDDVSYEAITYKNKNPEKYNTITGLDVTYDNYSKYQKEVSALKKKYEGTKNSKIRKQKVSEYINSLPLKKQQKIMLFKELGGYSISAYKNEMYQYINSLKISKSEKEKIWKRLYGKEN